MQVNANNAPARKKMRKIQEYGYITNKHGIEKIRQIERGGGGYSQLRPGRQQPHNKCPSKFYLRILILNFAAILLSKVYKMIMLRKRFNDY